MNRISDVAYPARILIVDDDRTNRQLMERMLTPEGFFIQTAASGEEALFLVEQRPPDLILLDVMMPGMDGYQLAILLKRGPATKNIPIIMVTGLADPRATLQGLDAGADDFLTKPVLRAELCVRVANVLHHKAYSDYHDRGGPPLGGAMGSPPADLRESERRYRAAFYATPGAIVPGGLNTHRLQGNERLYDELGHSGEALREAAAQAGAPKDAPPTRRGTSNRNAAGTPALETLDESRKPPAEDIVRDAEQLLARGRAEGLADGLTQGELDSLRGAITHVMFARAISLSAPGRARLTACADAWVLTGWLERAATATSEAEVFASADNA